MQLSPLFAATTVAATLAIASAEAADYLLDFSLETGPNHIRNIAVEAFAEAIAEKSKGRLEIRVFHGASQYKGAAVPTALGQGVLDMGAPGTWQLGRFVPEYNIPELPMFYGLGREVTYAVFDGEIGQALNRRVEEKLGVKVIGRYFDLGFGSLFFTETEVTGLDQLQGMKLRSPGGAANVKRLQVFGANPVTIPWPDVPQALQRRQIDGLLTTHESVRSAKLWDSGVRYAFDDNHAFFQYVPMMSGSAWNELPEDLRQLIVDTWAATIEDNRKAAEGRQAEARQENQHNGITAHVGTPEQLAATRAKLLAAQPAIVAELGMDSAFVERARAAIEQSM